MNTKKILTITALSLLGLCLVCSLAKTAVKKDSNKKNCDKCCTVAVFIAVVLLGVSQLLTEREKFNYEPCVNPLGNPQCCTTDDKTCSQRGPGGSSPKGTCYIDTHNGTGQGKLKCLDATTHKVFAKPSDYKPSTGCICQDTRF